MPTRISKIAALFVLAFMLFCTTQPEATAQRPPYISIEDYVLTVDSFPEESCRSPRIQDIAFVHLENGQVLVEVHFDPAYPLPSALTDPYDRVSLTGAKFGLTGTVAGGVGNVYTFQPDLLPASEEVKITYYDTCSSQWLQSGPYSVGCHPGIGGTIVDEQFQQDYQEFLLNNTNYEQRIHHWLNTLSYLTPIQRWSFYQQTYADCKKVSLDDFSFFIPDTYAIDDLPCRCSVVSFRKTLTPGEIAVDLGDSDIFGVTLIDETGTNYSGKFWDRFDFAAGPAKVVGGILAGHANWLASNEQYYSRTIGSDNAPIRELRTSVALVCRNGEALPARCDCERQLRVEYLYRASLETAVDVNFSTLGQSYANASVSDWAVVSHRTGVEPEVAEEAGIFSLASACNQAINPEFATLFTNFIGSLVGLNLRMTDSARVRHNDSVAIASGGQTLASLVTSGLSVGEPCNPQTAVNQITGAFELTLEPNEIQTVLLRSGDAVQVAGHRNYDAAAVSRSGYRVAMYLPSKELSDTPHWCCSHHMGFFISDSYHGAIPESELRSAIEFFLTDYGFDALSVTTDVGSVSRPNSLFDFCRITIEALHLDPSANPLTFVHDLSGRVVGHCQLHESLTNLDLPDGLYVQTSINSDGSITMVKKFVVMNGRIH